MTCRSVLLLVAGLLLLRPASAAEPPPVRVVVWDERQPAQKLAYPNFLGNQIAAELARRPGLLVKSVCLEDPGQGLSKETLDSCDVLIWWGHVRQREIQPSLGRDIVRRIQEGRLSLIALHSAHWSTPFVEAMNERAREDARRLAADRGLREVAIREHAPQLGVVPRRTDPTTPRVEISSKPDGNATVLDLWLPSCVFPAYRGDGMPSHVRVLRPDHPIVRGIPQQFDIPQTEMYDEPFFVPPPDEVVFEERWDRGERFRSGAIWKLGKGRVFYFRPGHETYPVFKQPEVLQILENSVRWLASFKD